MSNFKSITQVQQMVDKIFDLDGQGKIEEAKEQTREARTAYEVNKGRFINEPTTEDWAKKSIEPAIRSAEGRYGLAEKA